MNKKNIIAIAVGILIIAAGLFAATKYLFKQEEAADRKQTIITDDEDEVKTDSITVDIEADAEKKEVILTISGLADFTSLEYELSYDTTKGPKGTLSGSRPIPLSPGQDEFQRTITLGTCSRNVCTYDEGVSNIHVVLKLYPESGKAQILQKSFDI